MKVMRMRSRRRRHERNAAKKIQPDLLVAGGRLKGRRVRDLQRSFLALVPEGQSAFRQCFFFPLRVEDPNCGVELRMEHKGQ